MLFQLSFLIFMDTKVTTHPIRVFTWFNGCVQPSNFYNLNVTFTPSLVQFRRVNHLLQLLCTLMFLNFLNLEVFLCQMKSWLLGFSLTVNSSWHFRQWEQKAGGALSFYSILLLFDVIWLHFSHTASRRSLWLPSVTRRFEESGILFWVLIHHLLQRFWWIREDPMSFWSSRLSKPFDMPVSIFNVERITSLKNGEIFYRETNLFILGGFCMEIDV